MKQLYQLLIACFILSGFNASASSSFQPMQFDQNSYKNILEQNQRDNFIVLLWSLDCAPCIEELALINKFHQKNPAIKLVMISIDSVSRLDEMQDLLKSSSLLNINHWVFKSNMQQQLRYSIDPQWYGELPRSYFFSAGKKTQAISGRLKQSDLQRWLIDIANNKDNIL